MVHLKRFFCLFLALVLLLTWPGFLPQKAQADAVASDAAVMSLALLFTTWAGITFQQSDQAVTAMRNFISTKTSTAASLAGLITKGLVTEAGKLLITGDVRTAFRDVLPDIKSFFVTDPLTGTATLEGLSVPISVCYRYECYYSNTPLTLSQCVWNVSNLPDFYMVFGPDTYHFVAYGSSYQIYKNGNNSSSRFFRYNDGFCFVSCWASTSYNGYNSLYAVYPSPDGVYTSWSNDSQFLGKGDYHTFGLPAFYVTNGSAFFKQSKYINGTEAEELTWPETTITNPTDPSSPTEDGSENKIPVWPLGPQTSVITNAKTTDQADNDPGLDPEKMIEELRKLLQQQQTDPDPDPEPDPDPDPDPSDPDTPSGGDGTAPDFNGMMLPGLKDFFPFCIPFDLYNMMQALCAEPEAPKFQFATSFLGQVYTVDIDLSAWDNVAATIRYMVVAIFIVALAVATRKFIKW